MAPQVLEEIRQARAELRAAGGGEEGPTLVVVRDERAAAQVRGREGERESEREKEREERRKGG
jgi:hypothetical protein